jgi:aminoglycoside 3-N-acetyltransferase
VNTTADRRTLAAQFEALGLTAGDTVLVHASMRRVAPAQGRAATVVEALLDVLGPGGTIAVPTFTSWNSTSSRVFKAAIAGLSPQEAAAYRRSLPAFDQQVTAATETGALAETVRTLPAAHRSSHPQTSFAAVGRLARSLTATHDLDCHLGERSPLAALYSAGARVLLLGVGYDVCSAFHLAEYRCALRSKRPYECRISGHPGDGWTTFEDIELDDTEFGSIGRQFEAAGEAVRVGRTGETESRLFQLRDAVDFAEAWLRRRATQR